MGKVKRPSSKELEKLKSIIEGLSPENNTLSMMILRYCTDENREIFSVNDLKEWLPDATRKFFNAKCRYSDSKKEKDKRPHQGRIKKEVVMIDRRCLNCDQNFKAKNKFIRVCTDCKISPYYC